MADGPTRSNVIQAWSVLMNTLGRRSPRALKRSQMNRKAIRSLMQQGKR